MCLGISVSPNENVHILLECRQKPVTTLEMEVTIYLILWSSISVLEIGKLESSLPQVTFEHLVSVMMLNPTQINSEAARCCTEMQVSWRNLLYPSLSSDNRFAVRPTAQVLCSSSAVEGRVLQPQESLDRSSMGYTTPATPATVQASELIRRRSCIYLRSFSS